MSIAPQLSAEQTRFELQVGQLPSEALFVLGFQAQHGLSTPFDLRVDAASPSGEYIDPSEILWQDANLSIPVVGGQPRSINGVVTEMQRWDAGTTHGRAHYRLRIRPRLWTLSRVRRLQIFQDMSVRDIVFELLSKAGVDCDWVLQSTFAKRKYCVQYRETDLAFVSRLLEEEGIYYYFRHEPNCHEMLLVDALDAHSPIESPSELLFREETGMVEETDHVLEVEAVRQLVSNAVTLRDFNFEHPSVDLTSQAKDPAPVRDRFEVYEYPGGFEELNRGKSLAKHRLQELQAQSDVVRLRTRCRRLQPGYTFWLAEHPAFELNRHYLVESVREIGRQPEVIPANAKRTERPYEAEIVAVPADVQFRPPRITPRPVAAGAHTAIVTGPANEEIYTDQLGRVKVQFHWDRKGASDERSSCWMRVAQTWAGPGWGALFVPRIGHEVVVEFLDGDPDRPLITGAVYNGSNVPPVDLPSDKTRSTIRSNTSPGGNGANELRFEDAAGKEEVYLNAQRNLTINVKNDKHQTIVGKESLTVTHDRKRTVGGNQSLKVIGSELTTIHGAQSVAIGLGRNVAVGLESTESVGGTRVVQVGLDQTKHIGGSSTETVGADRTVAVAGNETVNVGHNLKQVIVGVSTEEVGSDLTVDVGESATEKVGGDDNVTVTENLTVEVGKASTLKIGGDHTVTVTGEHKHTVGKAYKLTAGEIAIAAAEGFTLKVGDAVIELKKSGDVNIKGGKLEISASGKLTLKGSKIQEN